MKHLLFLALALSGCRSRVDSSLSGDVSGLNRCGRIDSIPGVEHPIKISESKFSEKKYGVSAKHLVGTWRSQSDFTNQDVLYKTYFIKAVSDHAAFCFFDESFGRIPRTSINNQGAVDSEAVSAQLDDVILALNDIYSELEKMRASEAAPLKAARIGVEDNANNVLIEARNRVALDYKWFMDLLEWIYAGHQSRLAEIGLVESIVTNTTSLNVATIRILLAKLKRISREASDVAKMTGRQNEWDAINNSLDGINLDVKENEKIAATVNVLKQNARNIQNLNEEMLEKSHGVEVIGQKMKIIFGLQSDLKTELRMRFNQMTAIETIMSLN